MLACEFEKDNFIDQPKLAAAINKRLAIPGNTENPAAVVAAALVELQFVKKGI